MSNAANVMGVKLPLSLRAMRPAIALAVAFGFALLLSSGPGFSQDRNYRIRPGDTVWDLSGKYLRNDIPWQRLQAHNRINDPYRLPPGKLIGLPITWLKVQPVKVTVVGVHGNATAVDQRGQRTPVSQGMTLGIGTTLLTANDASLTLQFADGSRMLSHGGSEVVFDKSKAAMR